MGNTPSQSEILDEELKKLRRTFNRGRRDGPEWEVFGPTKNRAKQIREGANTGTEAYEIFINNEPLFNQWKNWFETNQMIQMMRDTTIDRKTDTGDVEELSVMIRGKRLFGEAENPNRSKKSKMAYRYLSMPQKAKKLPCNRPSKSYKPEKKRMVRACANGKEKLIHFGATGYKHNYSPKARANFRARHRCDTAKDKLTARYWACKNLWTKGGDKLTKADKSRRAPSDRRRKSTKKRRKSTKKRRKSTKKRRKSTKKRRKSTKKRR